MSSHRHVRTSPDTAAPSRQPKWHHNVPSGATLAAAPVGTVPQNESSARSSEPSLRNVR
jgi:hypothetical protein